MGPYNLERRRGRRAEIQAPLMIRPLAGIGSRETSREETTKNVSLHGAYFETDEAQEYRANDVVMASIAIPSEQTREFPFTRLAGRSRVVRVSEVVHPSSTISKRVGVALEFGEHLTALTAIPSRG